MATALFAGNPQVWASYNLTLENKQFDVQMRLFLLQLSQWATLVQNSVTPGSYYSSGGGATGPTGPPGPAGPTGNPAYTTTTASLTVPPVGSTTTVNVVNPSWVAVGEMVYLDQAGGGVGQAGALQVTAQSGNQLTLLTPVPPAAGTALQMVWGETPGGTINGVNTNFTSVSAYRTNLLSVYLNGLRQRRTNDYTETGSNSFQFVSAPIAGDILSIDYMLP
jgi:hypothetical protein